VLCSKALTGRASGRLDGSIQTLPNLDLFVFMYIRIEAVLSSQIEGTQASLHDVLDAESHVPGSRAPRDVGEVLNCISAMNYGLQRLETLPISIRLIREIHEQLMRGVRGQHQRPGAIRATQNRGAEGCALADATFVPPPPEKVMKCLGDLEKFLHADIPMPSLIKRGAQHQQSE